MSIRLTALLVAALVAVPATSASAGMFDDDEARRAILDLRDRISKSEEQNRARQNELATSVADQMSQVKRSLLELNNQIDALRTEIAKLRGNDEQLARDIADLQRRQKDIAQGVDERMRKIEPQTVTLDGREFTADAEEKRQFDEAMEVMRGGDFTAAGNAFAAFGKRWPTSGFYDASRFWLGNAQYGKRDYKEAIATFRSLITSAPEHPRAPEAMLALANCQVELKDTKSARKTLDDLVKNYPKSEAAIAARDRIASLK